MRIFIQHHIAFRFTEPQGRLVQLLRLQPGNHEGQIVVDWRIDVDRDARLKPGRDGFGNEFTMLYVEAPVEAIGISVSGEVLTSDRAGIVSAAPEPLLPLVFTQRTILTRADRDIASLARDVAGPGGSELDCVHRLRQSVHQRLRYEPGLPTAERDAATVLEEGYGGPQDFAHLFIATARELGFAARYVSGFLYREADGDRRNNPHGWAETHVPGIGWIGFDPVHDICPDERYVRVAIGLDSRDAAPVRGTRTGTGDETIDVGVPVELSRSQIQG